MDDFQTNWTVTIHATNGGFAGCGLSLQRCYECHAMVVEDFMRDHMEWHKKLPPNWQGET